jgi:hypothetical protein
MWRFKFAIYDFVSLFKSNWKPLRVIDMNSFCYGFSSCRRGMARHPSFPRFLSSACLSMRRLSLQTNHNMEAIFRLLEGRCHGLASLEVLTFISTAAGAALLDLLKTTPRLTTLKVGPRRHEP